MASLSILPAGLKSWRKIECEGKAADFSSMSNAGGFQD
ncbi:hypothetical protein NBRC3255_2853 [Gluconobacter thailandicus NBRC 3255]|nr:hypothetical protein NBRC3255_2853 [Gluconobacter thailandicus NBRC 3255]